MRTAWNLALPALLALLSAAPSRAAETGVQERASDAAAHTDAAAASRFSRDQWGLDETEWKRYQTLMAGVRGSISPPTLSPVEVLGIHARTDAERDKYAKQFAQIMREDAERVLAFQSAYDRAWQEINPSGRVADPSRLPAQSPKPGRSQPGDRLLLFVRPGGCAACDKLLAAGLQGRREGARLDIYFVGEAPDDAIRQWAKARAIDPGDVKDRRVTLNHERGELAQAAPGAEPPALVRVRGGEATRLQAQGNR